MQGKVQLYTGKGKGKTTAALGLGLRAVGAGKKVLLIQFMKPEEVDSSERKSIGKLENFEIESYGLEGFIREGDKESGFWRKYRKECEKAMERAEEAMQEDYDLLILDEVNIALYFDLLDLEDVLELIDKKPEEMELVLTGANAPEELEEKADLVTEMRKVKHYFDKGAEAREGVEY